MKGFLPDGGMAAKCGIAGVALLALMTAACSDGTAPAQHGGATEDTRVRVDRIRHVEVDDVQDRGQWSEALDHRLEVEFWDIVGNSARDVYPQWREKVVDYLRNHEDAAPRLNLLVAAGGVFKLTETFQDPLLGGLGVLGDLSDIYDAALRLNNAIEPLMDQEAAVVFYHNNQAMLSLLLGVGLRDGNGLCHLEQMRLLEDLNPNFVGVEGRAAAPFTYGFVNDPDYLDYAIELAEECDNWVCMWTTELAPFKPIGELLMLGELYWIRSVTDDDVTVREESRERYEEMFARAEQFAVERDWPFIERIEETRKELESRTSYSMHPLPIMWRVRYPMPVYANEGTCSNCHIGGQPGATGQELANPYPGHEIRTPIPPAPSFLPPGFSLRDCGLDYQNEG